MIIGLFLLAAVAVDIIAQKKSRESLQEAIDAGQMPNVGRWSYVGPWGTAAFVLWLFTAGLVVVDLISEMFFL